MTEDTLGEFWDSVADEFYCMAAEGLEETNELDGILGSLPVGRNSLHVLDIGTGSGLMAIKAARLGHSVVALDSSEAMLSNAKRLAEESGVEIRFVKADACETGLSEGSFDVVIARNVLFSIERCGDTVIHWKRLLRPGGFVVIMDGNYCFHLWSDEYARRREYLMSLRSRDDLQEAMGPNVDVGPLVAEIEHFYISKVRRPGWEIWFLASQGFQDIHAWYHDDTGYTAISKYGEMQVPVSYTLVARRPPEGEVGLISQRVRADAHRPKDLDGGTAVIAAVSSPQRIEILDRLSMGDMTVSEINETMGLESSRMAYHLRILKEAGLIICTRRGRNMVYTLSDPDRVNILLNTVYSISEESSAREKD
ncbi:MAG: metalloregulator ArsR/SmtB family transcription factor [Thermoplasmata archaeon]|nr:metalloregulator ArsR/SmtB family transcription factor [Thermoplasmata archaeon]